jgi:hypothetical protein
VRPTAALRRTRHFLLTHRARSSRSRKVTYSVAPDLQSTLEQLGKLRRPSERMALAISRETQLTALSLHHHSEPAPPRRARRRVVAHDERQQCRGRR